MPSEELIRRVILVGVGGAAGAVARWTLATAALRWWGQAVPWGTAIANLLGALLFGAIWAFAEQRGDFAPAWRLLLLTGFLGSFTTFSTLMFESVTLLSSQRPVLALLNLVGQMLLGIAFVYLGLWLGRGVWVGR